MFCCKTWVWIFPIIIALGVPVTFFVTYGIAVHNKHVHPVWPYISDTGTLPPESCIFGQILNIGALILAIIMYIRYRQVREWSELPSIQIPKWTNKLSFVLAMISCIGLDIVANFQESNVLAVHLLGAITCFVFGTLYCIMQTYFTYKIDKTAKATFAFRILLSIVSVGATVGALAPVKSAVAAFDGDNVLHWTANNSGYPAHVLSTSMEWILVFSFCFFIGTLFIEFRQVKISEPVIEVLNLKDKSSRKALNKSFGV